VEPMTADEFLAGTKERPRSLFAHNIQVQTVQNLHAGAPGLVKPKGVLGRMLEALSDQDEPYAAAAYSLSGIVDILDGDHPANILSGNGVTEFHDYGDYEDHVHGIAESASESVFTEVFNEVLERSLKDSSTLGSIMDLDHVQVEATWGTSGLDDDFRQVAKLVRAREVIGSERDVFYVQIGGFDTHNNLIDTVTEKMQEINGALDSFRAEMNLLGLWDSVVVLTASDFGRTIVSNGAGTDHAWGGNHFIMGGSIRGGQILGQYPSRLDPDHCVENIRQGGRLLPTTSWEAVWNGITEWFGVESVDEMMTHVTE